MKQLLQSFSDGTTELQESPIPSCGRGNILIRSRCSLISAGTERSLVSFGKSNYINKARQQPDKVREVINKVKTDGLMTTYEAVRSKLDMPIPMGYSNVGIVVEVGQDVVSFKLGDRVVSSGAHAEFVCMPVNLCAKIPDAVSDEQAVFTVLGAIALQGVRLSKLNFGESVAIVGLGLVGLMCAQIVKANGCRVVGFDFDKDKVKMAEALGVEAYAFSDADDAISISTQFSRGQGVDVALVAAASPNSDPMVLGAKMCRKKGRLTQIGVTELSIPRDIMFKKELTLQVSCSFGPGRYDESYELKGIDYPYAYVRWTEQRNFVAILDSIEAGGLQLTPMISNRFEFDNASDAYELLLEDKSTLGIILSYSKEELAEDIQAERTLVENEQPIFSNDQKMVIGAIGAGNHASRHLLPGFKKAGAVLKIVSSSQGLSGSHTAKKLGFAMNTTDNDVVMSDGQVNTIVIATQHSTHANLVIDALRNKKNIFVEKPLAINQKQLNDIESAYREAKISGFESKLMIGFNRRFSPLIVKMKSLIDKSNTPFSMIYTCNAGHIPREHWLQDPKIGGGRVIGEACHFIDIARFMAKSPIKSIQAIPMSPKQDSTDCMDTVTIILAFESGSIACINYFANGHKSFPKERIEMFQGNKTIVLDNFRTLSAYGFKSLKKMSSFRQNKGQNECCKAFLESIQKDKPSPIRFEEQLEVSQACLDVYELLKKQVN